MSEMRGDHLVLMLSLLLCFISYQGVCGLQINLTRFQNGDYFNNPYATSCDDTEDKFCVATNSICYEGYPVVGISKCCYCKCNVRESTFDLKKLRCAPNKEFRQAQGCSLRLKDTNDEAFLNAIDMSSYGQEKIEKLNWPPSPSNKLLDCIVKKIQQMTLNGYQTVAGQGHSFDILSTNHYDFIMNWMRGDKNVYGRVYKITFFCYYKKPGRKSGEFDDCVMLKSSGAVQIYHPGLPSGEKSSSDLPRTITMATTTPSTTISPPSTPSTTIAPILLPTTTFVRTTPPLPPPATTTTRKTLPPPGMTTSQGLNIASSSHLLEILPTAKELVKSTSTLNLHSSPQRSGFLQSSIKNQETVEISSTQTDIEDHPNPEETVARSTSRVSRISTIIPKKEKRKSKSDADTIIYVVPVVVVVVVIILAFVLRFTMIRKKKMLKKRNLSRVEIVISDIKNDLREDEDGLYAALDKSARNDESTYQALTLPGTKKNQSMINAHREKVHLDTNENIYADADRIYSTLAPQINYITIGAKDNDAFYDNENERVYSILEQQPGQIDYTTPSIPNENERVYSILEEGPGKIDGTSDYVTVLPSENETNQSDCAVYAELSGQKDEGNNYQSLIKRKK